MGALSCLPFSNLGAVFHEEPGQFVLLVFTATGQDPESIPGKAFIVVRRGFKTRQPRLGDQAQDVAENSEEDGEFEGVYFENRLCLAQQY